ncbi:hypothetical protein GALL_455910 [mine drainage metagenome]|uniref:Uncharacterized protein n=1 Tax=mine drainage metagenome TaxID=410659 RepID=A0A1J5PNP1_9ZZZZ
MRSLCGTDVGAHRDVHADIAGRSRQQRPDGETDRRQAAQGNPDQDEQYRSDHADSGVLAVKISRCAFLYGRCNFSHAFVSGRLGQHPRDGDTTIEQRHDSTPQRQNQCLIHRNPSLTAVIKGKAGFTPPRTNRLKSLTTASGRTICRLASPALRRYWPTGNAENAVNFGRLRSTSHAVPERSLPYKFTQRKRATAAPECKTPATAGA